LFLSKIDDIINQGEEELKHDPIDDGSSTQRKTENERDQIEKQVLDEDEADKKKAYDIFNSAKSKIQDDANGLQ